MCCLGDELFMDCSDGDSCKWYKRSLELQTVLLLATRLLLVTTSHTAEDIMYAAFHGVVDLLKIVILVFPCRQLQNNAITRILPGALQGLTNLQRLYDSSTPTPYTHPCTHTHTHTHT